MEIFKTAVILAGGKSTRMGFDKQFLEVNNKLLMENLICELKKEFQDIIIVTNKPEEYKNSKCRIFSDEIKEVGPLSGIHVGLKNSKSKYTYFIACDMPNINLNYIQQMKNEIIQGKPDACVSQKEGRIEPFNSFYSTNILDKVEELIRSNRRSMLTLINNIKTLVIDEKTLERYNKLFDMFINLNTREDLQRFEKSNKVEDKNG